MVALVALLSSLAPAAAQGQWLGPEYPSLPARVADADWTPLRESVDVALQAELRRAVEDRTQWRRLAGQRRLSVCLVDLADPARPRFAAINGEVMMYAASLPKIGILLAAYEGFEDGSLAETPEVHADLSAMIRVSSNAAATAMIDRIGFDKIAKVLTDPRYELYDPDYGGGLWVGKRFAKKGRRVGDPIANISHAASATQVCRFYYLLGTGRVISPERSRQILEDLSKPGINHKFVNALRRRSPRARLFRKSGSWQRWHSDSTLVWGPNWRRYVLVGMVESDLGESILRELVGVVEGVLKAVPAPTSAGHD